MSNDHLGELLDGARAWLDRAATHHHAGEISLAASTSRIGYGYAHLALAHSDAATLSGQERARVDFPSAEDLPPVPHPAEREGFPGALRPPGPAPSVTTTDPVDLDPAQ